MDHCIVYYSTAAELLQEADLLNIFRQSHDYNHKFNISGVLLYIDGNILQVIEGEQEPLEALFERIKCDSRHKDVIRVLNRATTQRLFDHWAMGYDTMSRNQLDAIKQLVDANPNKDMLLETRDNIILKMIKTFYETNR